jgi:hypothetical protein
VTEWVLAVPAPNFVVAMATRESLALTRVKRILGARGMQLHRRPRWFTAFILPVLATIVLTVPGVYASESIIGAYTVQAFDDAGPFSLTLERGVVVGATTDGVPLSNDRIEQDGRRVRVTDAHGSVLELTLTPEGGFRWTSRPRRPLDN